MGKIKVINMNVEGMDSDSIIKAIKDVMDEELFKEVFKGRSIYQKSEDLIVSLVQKETEMGDEFYNSKWAGIYKEAYEFFRTLPQEEIDRMSEEDKQCCLRQLPVISKVMESILANKIAQISKSLKK